MYQSSKLEKWGQHPPWAPNFKCRCGGMQTRRPQEAVSLVGVEVQVLSPAPRYTLSMVKSARQVIHEAKVQYLDDHGPPRLDKSVWWWPPDGVDSEDPCWRDAIREVCELTGEAMRPLWRLRHVHYDPYRDCHVMGPPINPPDFTVY